MTTLGTAYKYQYDSSGVSSTNLINGESRTFITTDPSVFVPLEGLFYGTSVTILNGGTPLVLGTDYELEALEPHYTHVTGKAVYAGIKRLSASMLGTIEITYQCLGGPEGVSNAFVTSLKEAINNAVSNPTVNWSDIVGKPSAFVPSSHKHYPSDLEDLDLLAQKFDDFIDAIVSVRFYKDSNHSLHNEILRLTAVVGSLRNSVNSIASITGVSSDITNIIDRLDNINREVDAVGVITTGATIELASFDMTGFIGAQVTFVFKLTDNTVAQKVTMDIINNGADIEYSLSNVIATNSTLIVEESDFILTDTGATFRISVNAADDFQYVTKINYVL